MIRIINEVNFNNRGDKTGIENAARELVSAGMFIDDPIEGEDYDFDGHCVVRIPAGGSPHYIYDQYDAFDQVVKYLSKSRSFGPDVFELSSNEKIKQVACDYSLSEQERLNTIWSIIKQICARGENFTKELIDEDWDEIWYFWFNECLLEYFYTDTSGTRWFVKYDIQNSPIII